MIRNFCLLTVGFEACKRRGSPQTLLNCYIFSLSSRQPVMFVSPYSMTGSVDI